MPPVEANAVTIQERDQIEVERSAAEAAKTVLDPVEVERYLNPPSDTRYGLEYAFYLLGDVHGKTVLDFGCGSGENLIPLIKRGANVIGMDISPELIALARQRLDSYGLDANLRVRSAYETGLPNESVDVLFSVALLHHLELPRVRAEIRRIMRSDGLFIMREPIRFSRTVNYLRWLFPPPAADISDYEHPMTRNEVAVVSQGFEIVAERNFRLLFVPLLTRFNVGKRQIWSLDRWLLRNFPGLDRIATEKVMGLRKDPRALD
jgi:SAM-dependent methyltransferase